MKINYVGGENMLKFLPILGDILVENKNKFHFKLFVLFMAVKYD